METREHFAGVRHPRTGELTPQIKNTNLFQVYGATVDKVRGILTHADLSNEEEASLAKNKVDEVINRLMTSRSGGAEEERLSSAVNLTFIYPILTKHYGFTDQRTPSQQKADAAFVEGYQNPRSALSTSGEPTPSSVNVSFFTDEALLKLEKLDGKSSKDLTAKERKLFALLEPSGAI